MYVGRSGVDLQNFSISALPTRGTTSVLREHLYNRPATSSLTSFLPIGVQRGRGDGPSLPFWDICLGFHKKTWFLSIFAPPLSLICLLVFANMSHWPLITKLGLEEACVSWNFIDTIKTMINNDLWWLPMREAIFGESLQVEIKELRCLYPRIIQGQEWLITIKNHILYVYT